MATKRGTAHTVSKTKSCDLPRRPTTAFTATSTPRFLAQRNTARRITSQRNDTVSQHRRRTAVPTEPTEHTSAERSHEKKVEKKESKEPQWARTVLFDVQWDGDFRSGQWGVHKQAFLLKEGLQGGKFIAAK